ncbi:MAG: hypothetical protein CMP07_07645 [Xanthomonadales bacterium]|nr:hypothetical protein [Xanthomonadales bacterium]
MQNQAAPEIRSIDGMRIADSYPVIRRARRTAQEWLRMTLPLLLAWSAGASAGGGSEWIEPGTGSWTTAENWSPASVPDSADVTIDNGGTAQVAGSAPPSFGLLTVGSANAGSIEISAGGSLDSTSFGNFGENAGSSGTL